MTKLELLKLTKSTLSALERNKISPSDVRLLPMLEDYQRLRGEGHKYEWILYYLGDQYGMSRSAVYRAVKRLNGTASV